MFIGDGAKMVRDAFLIGGITGVILCIILNLIEKAF
jgi:ATP-dependent 26S proteasome regulatory subunit